MREMKDSGIKWIGTIPQQWNVVKFKALFTPKSIPNSGDRELLSVYLDRGVIRYSDSSNMQVHKPSESLDKYQNVDIGDFVLNNQQAWRGSVGVSKYKGIISPAYLIYEMSKECFPQYMNYALRDCYMVQQYEYCSRGVGTIQRNVSPQWLKQALVLLPPLDEQKRISEYLDEECSQIDGLIADIQAQIDVLEQYKRSQITEAVTRGLVSNEPLKESGLAWIGNIPERWRVMPNKYLMKKLKLIQPVYAGEDIISLTVNGVIKRDLDNPSGKMPASFDGYQFVYPGNLLMCLFDIDVTPRCIGLIKDFGLTSPAYSQFVLNSKADAGYYYYYYLNLDFNKDLLHLAKNQRHSLNEEQFGAIPTVVPPVEEQKAIAAYLDEKCAEIDGCIAAKKEQISALEAYKKSVIFQYVTGKKEVEQ